MASGVTQEENEQQIVVAPKINYPQESLHKRGLNRRGASANYTSFETASFQRQEKVGKLQQTNKPKSGGT